jgi:hypothetical protein
LGKNWIFKTVRKYEKMGYYNLAKPEFINEVIVTFTNLELSKKDVIRVNNFMDIQGATECQLGKNWIFLIIPIYAKVSISLQDCL